MTIHLRKEALLLRVMAFLFLTAFQINSTAYGQTLPSGFFQELVAGGLIAPTTMKQAPDGRFFIAEQAGKLRVVKNNVLLQRPFITIPTNTNGERGLLGVTVDPDFTNNNYIYLCYTIADGSYNRVSRFTASGDTVVPGSEVVLLNLDTLIANYHAGGHLDFGPDGKLYITAGENGRSYEAQNLNSLLGKIIRINKDGSVPSDNPFASGTGKRRMVWAYGLRNPFTFSFDSLSRRLYVNDVGEVTWEEINDATTGGHNFGWPQSEGPTTDTNLTGPVYAYLHGSAPDQGCSITGGTFFNPANTNWPSVYLNNYFHIDYCGNWINRFNTGATTISDSTFASGIANYAVGIMTGNDGNLYFLSRNDQALYRVVYNNAPAPAIVTSPSDLLVSVGQSATFSVNATGAPVLTYQWKKNNVNIPGATRASYTIPAAALADSGDYKVVVTNSFGSTTSSVAHLTVTTNHAPVATITSPSTSSLYQGGDVITFSGTATDFEDGNVNVANYEWLIEFHHNTHIHPGPSVPQGVASGQFTIPTTGEVSANVFYRLILIIHDSFGLTDTTYRDILPKVVTLLVSTNPKGLQVLVDGQPENTPFVTRGVVGIERTIAVPRKQQLNGNTLLFTGWNNGGPISQTIQTPPTRRTYVANYGVAISAIENQIIPDRRADVADDEIQIFPNPANEVLFVQSTEMIQTITVLNMLNQQVYQTSINDQFGELNLPVLKTGLYSVIIQTAEETIIRKLMIQH